jgi:hypothetical protein
MSDGITREDIDKLRHFTKVAFAARCARIAWGLAPPTNLPALAEWLQRAEHWGEDASACMSAKRVAAWVEEPGAKLPGKPRPSSVVAPDREYVRGLETILPTAKDIPTYAYGLGPFESTLPLAIHAAVQTALSEIISPEQDKAATDRAAEAYSRAREAARFTSDPRSFLATAQQDFDALVTYLESGDAPESGAVSPEFFNARDSKYYNPPAPKPKP